MNTKRIANKVILMMLLPVLMLSACSSGPAATEAAPPVEAPSVAPTDIEVPATPTEIPPTDTQVPPTPTEVPTATIAPEGEGQVIVLAPYIQMNRGMLPWVEEFMAKTGCLVSVEDFVDYDQAVSRINTGGIDVVVAGASSRRLIDSSLVAEVDTSQVPSLGSVDPLATSGTWNSADGKIYGVPYLWIPNVLMYNTDVFPTPPTSWDVTFKEQTLPDGKSNKQRVAAPYFAFYIGDAAKYLMNSSPEAGITDPFRLTSSQFAMATELLYIQRQILGAYWGHDEPMLDFVTSGYAVSSSMPRVVKLMNEAGIPVASTVPQEGGTASAFTNMLLKNAPHPVCAYQWMEYALDAKVQGDAAGTLGANPFVAAACDGASALLSAEDCERNGFYRFSEFSILQSPSSDCGNGENNCVALDRWVDEFTALTNQ